MIAEIGLYALVLAAVTSLLQGTVPLIGASRRRLAWMALADRAALVQLLLVAIAFGCLVAVFVLSDFSVRLVAANSQMDTDLESEHLMRLTVLELLYTRRRTERDNPGLSLLDLEALSGRAREHLEFTIWYLTQKKYVSRSDGSSLSITVEGVEHVEENLRNTTHRRRLHAGPSAA